MNCIKVNTEKTTSMYQIILLTIIFFCSYSQVFSQRQSLPTPNNNQPSLGCDISDDHNVIAFITDDQALYIYKNNGTYFQHNQTITNTTFHLEKVDMTADGQWLLVIEHTESAAYIYKYDNDSQLFQYFQHFTGQATTGRAGAITDDHQLMFYGSDSGVVTIYQFDGTNFSFKETVSGGSNRIIDFAVTSDHSYLAFSSAGTRTTFIYFYNGSNYTHLQTISTNSGGYQGVFITDDHQYLFIASGDNSNKGYIYQFNSSNQRFALVETLQLSSAVRCISLSVDEEWLVVSTLDLTYVYVGLKENSLALAQTLQGGYYHRLSRDNKYLVIVKTIYTTFTHCTFESEYYLEGTDCLLCENGSYIYEDYCYNCSNDCLTCTNSSTICTSCQDGFYVNQNDECAQCMSYCSTCEDGSSCTSCISIFQPYNCIDICGNGIVPNDGECDLEAGVYDDGCTDECQVEDSFACTMNQSTYESTCEYVGPYSLQVKSMERELFENKVIIEFYITPALFALKQFPSQYFTLVEEGYSQTFAALSNDGLFSLTLHFNESIEGKNITLVVDRPPPFNFPEFNIKVSTSYPAYSYTDEEYVYGQFLYYFTIVLVVLALLLYFLGACSSKLAGIEAMYVVQYWFLQLIWTKGDLILPLYALSAIEYSTGFNYQFFGEALEDNFYFFNLMDTFSGNFNLSGILYLPPLIALVVVSIKLYLQKSKENYLSKKIYRLEGRKEKCCELVLYAVMFNYSYLLASLVLFFSQGSLTDISSFVLIGIYVIITLAIFILYYREVSDFKMFYKSFQLGSIYYYHAGIFIIYLTIVILFTSLLSAYPWMPFIPQVFLLLFTLINKPYTKKRENYRSALNILVMAVITSMSTFYFYAEETDRTWRMFVHSGVIGFLIFLILLWAYIVVVKDIYNYLIKQKEKQLVQIFYGDEETIKRLERQILESSILRNAPALQCEARFYQTTKSQAERKYYRSDRKFKKRQYSEEEVDEEIKRKLKEMGLEHSEEGVQLIKDEIGMLKVRKLMQEKKENVALTAQEREIFDAL